MFTRDLLGRWMLELGRARLFVPWAMPYCYSAYNVILFGVGPLGGMYWPRREAV